MQKIIEKQDELIKHYEEFVRVLSVSAILKHGEEAKEFVEIRNVLMKQLSALKVQEQVIDTTINPTNLPNHKDSKTSQAQSVEREDADLLNEIYERNDMQIIANSDIYLRGFQDGLTYKKDKSHGNPGVCPDCGSGVYNCKCQ